MGRTRVNSETKEFAKHVGKTMRAARKRANMKASSVAFDIGLSEQTISLAETGKIILSMGNFRAYCRTVGIQMWQVIKLAETFQWQQSVMKLRKADPDVDE